MNGMEKLIIHVRFILVLHPYDYTSSLFYIFICLFIHYELLNQSFLVNGVKIITGFAYVGGACVVNKRLEKVNSVAIIEDTGGFSGIIVAAHEVGHL